jgi:tetratricopeptide (TPR) repeat protein
VTHQTSAEDAAQHYKLATTYAEMGMIDEAMNALEVAVRSARSRFDAAGMLARLHLQRGAPAEAIEWYERAAEAPAPNPEAGRALLYELATTLEAQGENARALAVFLELQSDAGDYRDLTKRLQHLTKVQT